MQIKISLKIIVFAVFFLLAIQLSAADIPNVWVVGDHLEEGIERFLPGDLKQKLCFTGVEKAFKAFVLTVPEGSKAILKQLRARAKEGTETRRVLLLNCGLLDIRIRDGVCLTDTVQYRRNLEDILRIASKRGLETVWFSTPFTGAGDTDVLIAQLNRIASAVMLENGVTEIDYNSFCARQTSRSSEGRMKQKSAYLAESVAQWWCAIARTNNGIRRIKLWEGHPPAYQYEGPEYVNASARIDRVSEPELEVFLPQRRKNATAVIFFPGGGYSFLGFLRNARELSEILDPYGIAVIGLKYRTKRGAEVPLIDAQRAVRYVRAHAAEWGIDPDRIGVAGQSAGANMVLNLAGNYSEGDPDATDPVERESSRPGFMAVFASWNFGPEESSFVFKPDLPPFFVRHAKDDKGFQLILNVVRQMDEIGIEKDVLFLEKGGHGAFELDPGNSGHTWPDDFIKWLHKQDLYR
jgi:acetyl esterase/lipase